MRSLTGFLENLRKNILVNYLLFLKGSINNLKSFILWKKSRLFYSVFFASANWLMGVVEIYLIFYFFGVSAVLAGSLDA